MQNPSIRPARRKRAGASPGLAAAGLQIFDGLIIEIETKCPWRYDLQRTLGSIVGRTAYAENRHPLSVMNPLRIDWRRSFMIDDRNQVRDRRDNPAANSCDKKFVFNCQRKRRLVIAERFNDRFADIETADHLALDIDYLAGIEMFKDAVVRMLEQFAQRFFHVRLIPVV